MASRPFSIRMDDALLAELEARANITGEPKTRLAQRLIDEGLRMQAHPGIEFRDGPAGRRASVVGGPDVWEIIRVVTNSGTAGERAVEAIVTHMALTTAQARAAVSYYGDYRDEIDAWTRSNDELAERAEAAWLREQAAVGR